jgi:hypothetical protein
MLRIGSLHLTLSLLLTGIPASHEAQEADTPATGLGVVRFADRPPNERR